MAKSRRPATFTVQGKSAAFPGQIVEWEVVCNDLGIVARRKSDGRRVSITWKEAIGLALFEGRDEARDQKAEL